MRKNPIRLADENNNLNARLGKTFMTNFMNQKVNKQVPIKI